MGIYLRNRSLGRPDCRIIDPSVSGRIEFVLVMPGNINKPDLPIHNTSIAAMTCCSITMNRKAMPFNDRDELAEGALQAGHATGNPKAEWPSWVLPEKAARKKRH